uniref:Small ribosomal subunit protein uS11c n=1 Tax=Nephroselmis olivacea TaxID=31312 RepID=RR11_NEPOL|nr:ribosomal protein S11 [Nephroselmis olivacea]Q9TL27.1 RecName: Full=Small ribosomal subunit protein uS11c; AltName: Full=30S ribosomal protein S11, chloroplastic [Nephroselmis olivacea]AAD54789.1 ribosomal protein S11 [Nephroselmis olivacea]
MARQSKRLAPRRLKRKVSKGVVHIQASFNNTIVTITDSSGGVLAWSSAGACGFRGAKKGTPFAAQTAAETAIRQCIDQGMRQADIIVQGPGNGRETAIRALQLAGVGVSLIRDITSVPHNGCRPPKQRRI